ncbi:3',5'-cyclic AMP phosphodiesterase CpdA [Arthrobacter pigmenti]|uniref:3',5'-cyclic AMP phosphodiesterase CpdA n=1 Tax=Arthrobacter pigmenti TaxID=271432 RepID=A0A846RV61_9MICC|nr:metallophosphoesterase [Arthrobacter pigmenti]NJC24464.1 3',5'-cyclic AMP phosphodiesterase CpdA [Arthrobacter pigmenti]
MTDPNVSVLTSSTLPPKLTAPEIAAPSGGRVLKRRLRILHLSDTHLSGNGSLHHGIVDTMAALERTLNYAVDIPDIDVFVLSGDLSDDGTEESYRRLRQKVEPWAAARSIEVIYAMGNHDLPDVFASVLGKGERAVDLAGYRIITLDSSVAGHDHGSLSVEQLEQLVHLLAEPAVHGTIIVLHHPPTAAVTPLLRLIGLENPNALSDALHGTDVRLVLSGHYHHALSTTERGIPVVVAPGVANTSDVTAPRDVERPRAGSGFALIDLPSVGAPRVSFVAVPGPLDGKIVIELDSDALRAIAHRLEASS